jgi:ribosome-associated toxin RatA of RatAB toxin-antitoxin module
VIEYKIEVNAPVEVFWEVANDAEKYIEFQKELKRLEVLKVDGKKKVIRHHVEIMKPVYYDLEYSEDEQYRKCSFKLVDCSTVKIPLFKEFKFMERDEGYWSMEPNGPDKTTAVYHLDVKFASKIPTSITDMLAKSGLPGMMNGFKKRAEELYQKRKG